MSSLLEVFKTHTVNSSYIFPKTSLTDQLDQLDAPFSELDNSVENCLVSISSEQQYINWVVPAVKLPFWS